MKRSLGEEIIDGLEEFASALETTKLPLRRERKNPVIAAVLLIGGTALAALASLVAALAAVVVLLVVLAIAALGYPNESAVLIGSVISACVIWFIVRRVNRHDDSRFARLPNDRSE
jgi:membrane protein implicated in regulation of membrane protease activity